MKVYDWAHSRASTRPVKPPVTAGGYSIERHRRTWKVLDSAGELVCLTVYKRGAEEVVRRLCG